MHATITLAPKYSPSASSSKCDGHPGEHSRNKLFQHMVAQMGDDSVRSITLLLDMLTCCSCLVADTLMEGIQAAYNRSLSIWALATRSTVIKVDTSSSCWTWTSPIMA